MTPCDRYQEQLSCLLDGELSPEERRKLAAHIRTCPDCRGMYEAFRGLSAVLAEETVAPPEDLTARIMSAVRAAPAPAHPSRTPSPAPRPDDGARNVTPIAPRRAARADETPRQHAPRAAKSAEKTRRRVSPLVPLGTIAACLVLLIGAVALFGPNGAGLSSASNGTALSQPAVSDDAGTAPEDASAPSSAPVAEDGSAAVSALADDADSVTLSVPEEAQTEASASERQITDAETLRSLTALLVSDTACDAPAADAEPACVLENTDADGQARACTVWLVGDDVVFQSAESDAYYRVPDAAKTFRALLRLT